MKIKSIVLLLLILVGSVSCVSTKSTLKNVNNSAPIPKLTASNTFVITQYSKDPKYGYNPDYPINVFYKNAKDETINQQRYLNALSGPKGEKLFFKKIEVCCPFPTKNSEMGGGFLDIYEVTWVGQKSPIKLYLNIYEKGELMVPMGFELAK
jgi:hypothetical protein